MNFNDILKRKNTENTGFAIAIAWTDTYCKQAGAWYDGLLNFLGIAKNNYYKVGHAAVLLIDSKAKKCHYFDFGRYHSPFGFGRVRSEETDFDLRISTNPQINETFTKIENYDEILTELQSKDAFHGEGKLQASYTNINFNKAYKKASKMQLQNHLPYGPFHPKGTNCSRFVNTVIRGGKPNLWLRFKLYFLNPLTPTPFHNVFSLPNKRQKDKQYSEAKFHPISIEKKQLEQTLLAPKRAKSIPKTALWLGGEGVGSWFFLEKENEVLKITRYSVSGKIECSGFFKGEIYINKFPLENVKISYPSNCKYVKIILSEKEYIFNRVTLRNTTVRNKKRRLRYELS